MPRSYSNILCVGDSHASTKFTTHPWPYWLSQSLECKTDVLSSPGAGSQVGIDKLCLKLKDKHYDLIVFQLSHEYRNTMGMNYDMKYDTSGEKDDWEQHGNKVGEEFLMCLNPSNNVGAMTKFFRGWSPAKKLFKRFDEWYIQYVADNNYELYVKQMQQIFTIQQICKSKNTPCIIFPWHRIKTKKKNSPLFDSWKSIIDWDLVLEDSAEKFLEDSNLKKPYSKYEATPVHEDWSVDGYHLNDNGSKLLVEKMLVPSIIK